VDEFGELGRWIVDRPMQKLRDQLRRNADLISPALRDKLIMEAVRAGQQVDMRDQDAMSSALASIEGTQFLLWLLLRTKHPDLTLVEASKLVTLDNLEEIQQAVDKASGVTEAESLGEASGGKAREEVPQTGPGSSGT